MCPGVQFLPRGVVNVKNSVRGCLCTFCGVLGLANCYSGYVNNYANIASPFKDALKDLPEHTSFIALTLRGHSFCGYALWVLAVQSRPLSMRGVEEAYTARIPHVGCASFASRPVLYTVLFRLPNPFLCVHCVSHATPMVRLSCTTATCQPLARVPRLTIAVRQLPLFAANRW